MFDRTLNKPVNIIEASIKAPACAKCVQKLTIKTTERRY